MWGYYGSKSKIVKYYPKPKFGKIIEPFAGTAQYSLKYWDRDILLIDKYDVIVRLWKWLQNCSPRDITGIRHLKCGENVDNFKWDCDEQKWLIGFIIAGAPSMPKKTATKWKTVIRPNTQNYKLNLIADNLHKIRHWDIQSGSFEEIKNQKATWFIDPPYISAGKYYKYGNKDIDYDSLGDWCRERFGETIVCEQKGASWLPFNYLISSRGNCQQHHEVVWLNKNK